MSFLALFLVALFRVKTVNLAELVTEFIGKAKQESNDKRLQRFFGEFEVDVDKKATAIALSDLSC